MAHHKPTTVSSSSPSASCNIPNVSTYSIPTSLLTYHIKPRAGRGDVCQPCMPAMVQTVRLVTPVTPPFAFTFTVLCLEFLRFFCCVTYYVRDANHPRLTENTREFNVLLHPHVSDTTTVCCRQKSAFCHCLAAPWRHR